jgi:nicotinamide riboside kinase
MNVDFKAAVIFFVVSQTYAQAPDTLWTKTYGWPNSLNEDVGYTVLQTTDGGYVVVGYTDPSAPEYSDIWFLKTDTIGDTLWTKTYGGHHNEVAWSARQTFDGGYIIVGSTMSFGAGNRDVYLVKIDSLGDTLWTGTYGLMDLDEGYDVQQTSDSGYIVVGVVNPEDLLDNMDVYLIKTDTIGDTLWTRTYGGDTMDRGYSVQQTSDGGYIITGYTTSFDCGGGDVYLIKTDAIGDTTWTRTYGGTYYDEGYAVQQTFDSGYIIVGRTNSFSENNRNIYIIKTDTDGDTLWTRIYGGADEEEAWSVQQLPDSGYIIAGYTQSFGAGFADVYLLRTDADGDTLWTLTYGGEWSDKGYSVQQTSDQGYIITGYTYNFTGGFDVYLVKTEPDPVFCSENNSLANVQCIVQNKPNPFSDKCTITYFLPQSDEVHVTMYSVLGEHIIDLLHEYQHPGQHTLIWDGIDGHGGKVPNGVYFMKFCAGDYRKTTKLLVLK